MSYFWPVEVGHAELDHALHITMRYLQLSGQCDDYLRVEMKAVTVILDYWRAGETHPIYLANKAINAVERGEGTVHVLYPTAG